MEPYKTKNFIRPWTWIKRTLFVCAFGFLFQRGLFLLGELTNTQLIIGGAIIVFLILAGQVDEIEINDSELIVSQRSLIPFLRSRRVHQLADIEQVKTNNNTMLGDSLFIQFLYSNRRAVEVNFRDGESEIFRSSMHPSGDFGLRKEIEKRMAQRPIS